MKIIIHGPQGSGKARYKIEKLFPGLRIYDDWSGILTPRSSCVLITNLAPSQFESGIDTSKFLICEMKDQILTIDTKQKILQENS